MGSLVTKVYAVESGEYSGYSVDYIFATRELAEDACEKINNGERYDISEVVERDLLTEPLKVYNTYTFSSGPFDEVEQRPVQRRVSVEIEPMWSAPAIRPYGRILVKGP